MSEVIYIFVSRPGYISVLFEYACIYKSISVCKFISMCMWVCMCMWLFFLSFFVGMESMHSFISPPTFLVFFFFFFFFFITIEQCLKNLINDVAECNVFAHTWVLFLNQLSVSTGSKIRQWNISCRQKRHWHQHNSILKRML